MTASDLTSTAAQRMGTSRTDTVETASGARTRNLWIDSAKTHAHFVRQAAAVWPRLRVGSIVHLVDNLKQQAHFVYAQFVRSGELEVAYLAFGASPWSFVVRRPLDWAKVDGFSYGLYNASEWAVMNAELEALVHRFARTFGALEADVQVTIKLLRQKSDQLRLTSGSAPKRSRRRE